MRPVFCRQLVLALIFLWLAACTAPTPTHVATANVLPTIAPTLTLTSTLAPTLTPPPTATIIPTFVPVSLAARLAFVSERDGNEEIYLMNTDGSLVNLTNDPRVDREPDWSPDGSRITFESYRTGAPDIYVMNVDGSGLLNLTNHPGYDISPAWSPDGTRIAFLSDRENKSEDGNLYFDLFVINVDGSGLVNLTKRSLFPRDFAWSPDGWRLAYWERGEDQHNGELYRINVDGSHRLQLTNDPSNNWHPRWSPDGAHIAFSYGAEGMNTIHAINPDGSGKTALTHYIEGEFDGDVLSAWSPDGHRIAFVSDRDGYYAVYIMNSDGSNPIRLTDGWTGNADSPQWSPDGTQIAFTHGFYNGKDYIEDIYLINVNNALQAAGGSEPVNLTDHPADDDSVIWQP